MSPKIDPITRSVVQHRLSSIVAEMGEAMLRTSYSQILNSSRDFSLAVCDVQARLIAQADHIPVHVGALPWATRAVEERFQDVSPGEHTRTSERCPVQGQTVIRGNRGEARR